MVWLYTAAMFVGALLVFVVQPMVARMLLPSLGGSSAVWTTCMLFFQTLLLAGYGYAHLSARFIRPRVHRLIHIPLMAVVFVALPIALPELSIDPSQHPVEWLLIALALAAGLPFFVTSTSAPLLQHWFAHTGHEDAGDPYYLYAASNFGSMVALLGYPFVIQPWFGLEAQSRLWTITYGLLVALTLACAITLGGGSEPAAEATTRSEAPELTWKRRLFWIGWAFFPSSLMLGVTQKITTDVAPVPLLWVVPLALYLLSFILAFARRDFYLPRAFRLGLPMIALVVMSGMLESTPIVVQIVAHLAAFFLVALYFHGDVARDRPHVGHLTQYFLLISVGGALGGTFNALIAPVVFDLPVDYIVVLAVAIMVIPPLYRRSDESRRRRWVVPAAVALVVGVYLYFLDVWDLEEVDMIVLAGLVLVAATGITYLRPRVHNVVLGSILLFAIIGHYNRPGLITYERSFFAAYQVYDEETDGAGVWRRFIHGTTVHGMQPRAAELRTLPSGYYHPDGPVGQLFETFERDRTVILGLGTGALATYAEAGTHFEFFEIDPLVEDIAREHFTYLDDCGDACSVAIGDGRKLIEDRSDARYDIIFLDAYNSDSVPTHLLTREAVASYVSRLSESGIMIFHTSNRYIDVESVVGVLAEDAGLVSRTRRFDPPEELRRQQATTSRFTVVARTEEDLAPILDDERWKPTRSIERVWTDDFVNLMGVVHWE